jgi:hypothetical protein
VSIEEDTNFDGRSDAWTALRGGQVVGRRVDSNGDDRSTRGASTRAA